jgi:phosphohistidine phosphatase
LGTRRLILLRHGHATPEAPGLEDFERALTVRGIDEAESIGRWLSARRLVPDCLVASPAARTRATLSLVARRCGLETQDILWLPELYQAGPETVWSVLAARKAASLCVLICGHNPALSQVASLLGKPAKRRDLPTAGLATAVWDADDWSAVQPADAQRCECTAPGETGS